MSRCKRGGRGRGRAREGRRVGVRGKSIIEDGNINKIASLFSIYMSSMNITMHYSFVYTCAVLHSILE